MATTPSNLPQLMSGGRGVIKFTDADGVEKTLGIATDISVNIRHDLRPTFVVGEMQPMAIDPTGYDVDVSLGRIIPISAKQAAPAKGVKPTEQGAHTAIELGFEEAINDILNKDTLTIAIYDKITGQTMAAIQGCRFSGRSMSMATGDLASERYNFVGIYDSSNNNTATTGYDNA